MSFTVVFLLALLQGEQAPADGAREVGSLVSQESYKEALAAAKGVEGPDGAALEVWVRHQAGDLTGALGLAEHALQQTPQHAALLEQASYLSASLFHGREAHSYAQELEELGHPKASALQRDALDLLDRESEVSLGRTRAGVIIAAFAALAAFLLRWGTRPATS